MGKCGKKPCLCNTKTDEAEIEIPFLGGAVLGFNNNTSPSQVASFVALEDQIPICLAMSLYTGTPRNNIPPWVLINSSVTARTACWIHENTIIIACRGTSVGATGGGADVADDKVRLRNRAVEQCSSSGPARPSFFVALLLYCFANLRLLPFMETIAT